MLLVFRKVTIELVQTGVGYVKLAKVLAMVTNAGLVIVAVQPLPSVTVSFMV